MGISSSLYLDDWLLCSPSKKQCTEDLQKTLYFPRSRITHQEEEIAIVSISSDYILGVKIDSEFLGFSVPQKSTIMSSNSPQLPRAQVLLDQQLDDPFGNPHIYREVHKPGEVAYKGTAALFTFFLQKLFVVIYVHASHLLSIWDSAL